MKDINFISEKYRKYLLEVLFAEQRYYTVFGADFTQNEIDKLLVDADANILLFPLSTDLLSTILKSTSFFDSGVLQAWAKEIWGIEEPYSVINFDVLKNTLELKDTILLKSVYDALGIVEDYANQVGDERLLALLSKDILLQFKDDLADYFTWSESKTFRISVNTDVVHLSLKEIHIRLSEKVNIYQ
ncbi:hypothetical protein MRBLMN1_005359 [Chitinophaga ginsengisegetis]|uniref:hypothetical protein n=1 Tax=Chitinophaga ginsengisegetis TaxID=393003 RepID=UPI003436648C